MDFNSVTVFDMRRVVLFGSWEGVRDENRDENSVTVFKRYFVI